MHFAHTLHITHLDPSDHVGDHGGQDGSLLGSGLLLRLTLNICITMVSVQCSLKHVIAQMDISDFFVGGHFLLFTPKKLSRIGKSERWS